MAKGALQETDLLEVEDGFEASKQSGEVSPEWVKLEASLIIQIKNVGKYIDKREIKKHIVRSSQDAKRYDNFFYDFSPTSEKSISEQATEHLHLLEGLSSIHSLHQSPERLESTARLLMALGYLSQQDPGLTGLQQRMEADTYFELGRKGTDRALIDFALDLNRRVASEGGPLEPYNIHAAFSETDAREYLRVVDAERCSEEERETAFREMMLNHCRLVELYTGEDTYREDNDDTLLAHSGAISELVAHALTLEELHGLGADTKGIALVKAPLRYDKMHNTEDAPSTTCDLIAVDTSSEQELAVEVKKALSGNRKLFPHIVRVRLANIEGDFRQVIHEWARNRVEYYEALLSGAPPVEPSTKARLQNGFIPSIAAWSGHTGVDFEWFLGRFKKAIRPELFVGTPLYGDIAKYHAQFGDSETRAMVREINKRRDAARQKRDGIWAGAGK